MIHTALKSAQAVETKAVKPLKCENDTPKVWCNGAFEVASRNVNREFYQHPHKPSSHWAESCKIVSGCVKMRSF
jgi:hypothetical protein